MLPPIPTPDDIRRAHEHIAEHVHRTPLVTSSRLGQAIGSRLDLKCENLQKTGSFKVRGALYKLLRLDDEARQRGVITISAGNHAQALAWASGVTHTPCVVVMPAGASRSKAAASRAYGAEVILHGTVHEAFEKTYELADSRGLTFVHPFDDPDTISGQGTVGLEILEQQPDVNTIVVPVGGGGQIGGIAAFVKPTRPEVRIFGVEPEGACAMRISLDRGEPAQLDRVDTVADGLAPPMAGKLNYEIVSRYVDDVVIVSDDEILDALGRTLSATKLLTEPAGSAAMAALLTKRLPLLGDEQVVAVLSGGNIGLDQLSGFLARATPDAG